MKPVSKNGFAADRIRIANICSAATQGPVIYGPSEAAPRYDRCSQQNKRPDNAND